MDFSTVSHLAIFLTILTGPFYLFATYYYAGAGTKQASLVTIGLGIYATLIILFVTHWQFLFENPFVMPVVMLISLAFPSLLVLSKPDYFVPQDVGMNWLLGVQAFRLIGGLYLLECFRGNIGIEFAYWAGIGDMLTAVAALALLLVFWLKRSIPSWAIKATIWFGIADFAWAYGIGVLSFQTPIQVFSLDSVHSANLYPIAMIPFLLAPIAMAYMIMTLIQLKRSQTLNVATN